MKYKRHITGKPKMEYLNELLVKHFKGYIQHIVIKYGNWQFSQMNPIKYKLTCLKSILQFLLLIFNTKHDANKIIVQMQENNDLKLIFLIPNRICRIPYF